MGSILSKKKNIELTKSDESPKKLSLRERRNMRPLKISISNSNSTLNSCDLENNSNIQKNTKSSSFNNFFSN